MNVAKIMQYVNACKQQSMKEEIRVDVEKLGCSKGASMGRFAAEKQEKNDCRLIVVKI